MSIFFKRLKVVFEPSADINRFFYIILFYITFQNSLPNLALCSPNSFRKIISIHLQKGYILNYKSFCFVCIGKGR